MGQQVNVYKSLNMIDGLGVKTQILTSPTQWFTEQSVSMQYPIGTKLVVEDMVFRYGHCALYAELGNYRGRGQKNLGKQTSANNTDPGHRRAGTGVAFASGALSATLTMDGAYSAGAGEFKDGFLQMASSPFIGYVTGRIRTNDATSTTTVFYFKEGLNGLNSGTSPNAKIHWNPYAHVGQPKVGSPIADTSAVSGCLWVNTTEDYYCWLQTWGPYICQGGEAGSEDPGLGSMNSSIYFDSYGGFINPATESLYKEQHGRAQLAGFMLGGRYSGAGTAYDCLNLCMLQISP